MAGFGLPVNEWSRAGVDGHQSQLDFFSSASVLFLRRPRRAVLAATEVIGAFDICRGDPHYLGKIRLSKAKFTKSKANP